MTTPVNIFWFRRDLRLEDNHGLYKACINNTTQPVFIFDTDILKHLDTSDARVTYIYDSLQTIQNTLKPLGKGLKIYCGDVLTCWKSIVQEFNVQSVYTNKDYEPYALQRDKDVSDFLKEQGIDFIKHKDQVIFEEHDIVKSNGAPYTVYTPYKNLWLKTFKPDCIIPFPSETQTHRLLNINTTLPDLKDIGFQRSTIHIRPINFTTLNKYDEVRDFPGLNETSNLSVCLRFGTFSIRKAVDIALKTNHVWLNELIWRSFFMQILFHFPHVVTQPFKPIYKLFPWRNNKNEFKAWCKGETGYPMVDAGMRELNATGYMHNRVRMVCASFLCKHLLIDWRWGEAYFAQKLLDYDLSANNGNWQWAASTGCDSVPYFRIFNPETQIKKFDPNLTYIKRWVDDFEALTYPQPIIPHKEARERCLKTFKDYLNS